MAEGNHVEAVEEIGTGQAIHYSLERWTALLVFVDDGRVEMDNNAAELRCGQLQRGVHYAPHFQMSENMDVWFSGFGRYGRPFRAIAMVTRSSSRSLARIWYGASGTT
jgi:hypothetical protein